MPSSRRWCGRKTGFDLSGNTGLEQADVQKLSALAVHTCQQGHKPLKVTSISLRQLVQEQSASPEDFFLDFAPFPENQGP